jgi:signal recognition particle receptor subunit beta
MTVIDQAAREIRARIVYWGPAGSGKTASLQAIHDTVAAASRGELVTGTTPDGTAPFESLALSLGSVRGLATKVQVCSAPGSAALHSRRPLLEGADGVVFVADSDPSRLEANRESLGELIEALRELGRESCPVVLQANLSDLPGVLPGGELADLLGWQPRPVFETVASEATGVLGPLKAIFKALLGELTKAPGEHSEVEGVGRPALTGLAHREAPPPPAPSSDPFDDLLPSPAAPEMDFEALGMGVEEPEMEMEVGMELGASMDDEEEPAPWTPPAPPVRAAAPPPPAPRAAPAPAPRAAPAPPAPRAAPAPTPGPPEHSDTGPDYPAGDGDPVECTLYAPGAAGPGESILVQAWAHLREEAQAVLERALEADPDAGRRGSRSLGARVPRGTRLGFELLLPGLEVDDDTQFLVWRGQADGVQFSVAVPEEQRAGSLIGTLRISADGVPAGHLRFKLVISAQTATAAAPARTEAARYRRAFISYAAVDRPEVVKRVQMLARLHIDFFQDVLDLEPGERWESVLQQQIEACDLFLLFWSSAARDSEWVRKEIRHAMQRGEHAPEIVPVIIEGPPPPQPPLELQHLHFNDRLLYLLPH